MSRKSNSIPVNPMIADFGTGAFIGRVTSADLNRHWHRDRFNTIRQSHRDEYHLFFLQEKGTTTIEIDFQKHTVKPLSVIFIHQNQVHRILSFKNTITSIWAISNENLNREYFNLLQAITPAKPLTLKKEIFSILSATASLCLKIAERRQEKLYHSLLIGSCNTLTGLVASQYAALTKSTDKLSRYEIVNKAFSGLLENKFTTIKKPAEYAQLLNISGTYLNECIRNTTGASVSNQIQQRVVLEAKRLLYHSDKSIKEIASELGYDDHQYFSRLFTKVAGMPALAFRNKNRD